MALQLAAERWLGQPMDPLQRPAPPSAEAGVQQTFGKFRQILELVHTNSLSSLLDLPNKLMDSAVAARGCDAHDTADAQAAIAIEILLMVPIFLSQLVALREEVNIFVPLDLDRSAKLSVACTRQRQRLLHFELPSRSVRLLQIYRGILVDPCDSNASGWLFRGRDGRPRQAAALGELITRKIWKHVGIKLTPRAIRFLSGTLYLTRNSDGYEVVRRAMGHTTIKHTKNMYRFVRVTNAAKRFDSLLLPVEQL
jgi:integrase